MSVTELAIAAHGVRKAFKAPAVKRDAEPGGAKDGDMRKGTTDDAVTTEAPVTTEAHEHRVATEPHEGRVATADPADGPGLNGFDLEVAPGSVCGLLGPNGAGKTTAVRVLTTLLAATAGEARVAGFDIATQGRQVRERIGLVGQYAAVDEILTGRANLEMFARLNHLSWPAARRRAGELLERFDLVDAATRPVATYSGGMRRRLDLAASLIVSPPVLFVDEPTTGLDPQGRREVWDAIGDLVDAGTTVLLTTQYLEEADQLADRIAMLRAGRVVAEGTPEELKAQIGGDWIDITFTDRADLEAARPLVTRHADGALHDDTESAVLGVPVSRRTAALVEVATALRDARIEPEDITLRRPTLDEVFLHINADEKTGVRA